MTKQLVFIDESGDPGFKAKSSANFSFALVVFEDTEQAEEAEKAINNAAVLSRHLSEFKYSKTCNHVKDIFFNEISKCSFRAKALYVNKMEITSEELRNNANKFYNFFLKQVITHAQLSDASLKLDGKKDTVKKELVSYIRAQAQKEVAKIRYEDSKNNRLIQLADMIAGLVNHAYSANATLEQKEWVKILKNKLDIWQFK
jgi:hypothetical protein|uniref:DUF3800 domain-containing protein n=1 Tax=Siphoviridae sp. ct5qs5 TaxID=2825339 RepID=A0A8S5QA06_9CAUD|nr:MAG TPA: Protein of unknown function (DUF3800) [Siphoviridae sp. ct5qs5]